jgi:DNA-binding MarR family transcriptional regulator
MPTIEEIIKTRKIEDPYLRAILNVMYTGNWLYQRINTILKPFDLTEPQYNILRILRGQHGNAMGLFEIQNRMVQQMSNVSRLVDKLYAKEYVKRVECMENRRRVDISITPQGLEVLKTVDPLIDIEFAEMGKNIGKEDASILGELLDKLRG